MLNDREIRGAMLEHFRAAGLRTVEEWYVGGAIIDVAVIDAAGVFGYEIKGENDSLARLARQAENYGRVLDRCTLVTAQRHLGHARARLPTWWGLTIVSESATAGGPLVFTREREPAPNPDQLASWVAAQLYARECVALCQRLCIPVRDAKSKWAHGKGRLVQSIADRVPLEELRRLVPGFLLARPYWKADGRRTLGKDTKRPGVPTG